MTAPVQESGEFSLRVVPGEYTLTAQVDDQIAKTRVTVDRSDVGVDLVLAPGARIAGRVLFEGTSRRPDGIEVVAVPPEEMAVRTVRMNYQPARIRPDGSFRLTRCLAHWNCGSSGHARLAAEIDHGRRTEPARRAGRLQRRRRSARRRDRDDRSHGDSHWIRQRVLRPLPASLSVLVFPNNPCRRIARAGCGRINVGGSS
jgi:hypothetical protein